MTDHGCFRISVQLREYAEEDSEKISIDKSGAKVSFTDADAGSKTVEGTGFTITGEKAYCYKLPDRIAGTGEITKKEISLSFEGVDKDMTPTPMRR